MIIMKDISYKCDLCRQGSKKVDEVIGFEYVGTRQHEHIQLKYPPQVERHLCPRCLLQLHRMFLTVEGMKMLKEITERVEE